MLCLALPLRPMRHDGPTAPIAPASSTKRAPIAALIRVLDASAQPTSFLLRTGVCTIGSSRSSDIVVSETTVSRAHVELELAAEGVAVRDLGSRNGTFYLGQRIERAVLSFGARIRVGAVTVAIEADADALNVLLPKATPDYGNLVGGSLVMRRLFAMLLRLEGSLATVLIQGESGCGKELVAQALHDQSKVNQGAFVALNCGALPRETLASELFGHRKGAFTGALESRRGAFESADGGTLFLDEIGELPLEIQPHLLRAIELGEIRPLGEDKPKRVKVRLIAATNRELEVEVKAGRFRQDLFFRLAVVRLSVPALRERREDIEALAQGFAAKAGAGALPAELLESLKARDFPGNVRELKNAIESYAALGFMTHVNSSPASDSLDESFKQLVDLSRPYAEQKEEVLERFTAVYLRALLESTGGNQSEAAKISGLNRGYIGRLLTKHGQRGRGEGAP